MSQNLGIKEFFSDFWAMILERFQADFGTYENLGASERTLETIRLAVIAFFAAIMVAAVVINVKRWLFGSLVRRLNDQQVWSADTAKTIGELGLKNNLAVKAALRMGGQYKGLVHCVEEDAYIDKMEKMRAQKEADYAEGATKNPYVKAPGFVLNWENHRFYIPEEKMIKASRQFERRGTGVGSLIAILLLSLFAMFTTIYFLPNLVQFLDNFVGIIKK